MLDDATIDNVTKISVYANSREGVRITSFSLLAVGVLIIIAVGLPGVFGPISKLADGGRPDITLATAAANASIAVAAGLIMVGIVGVTRASFSGLGICGSVAAVSGVIILICAFVFDSHGWPFRSSSDLFQTVATRLLYLWGIVILGAGVKLSVFSAELGKALGALNGKPTDEMKLQVEQLKQSLLDLVVNSSEQVVHLREGKALLIIKLDSHQCLWCWEKGPALGICTPGGLEINMPSEWCKTDKDILGRGVQVSCKIGSIETGIIGKGQAYIKERSWSNYRNWLKQNPRQE